MDILVGSFAAVVAMSCLIRLVLADSQDLKKTNSEASVKPLEQAD